MVHQYQLNGYYIVVDTCSGSIHSVDDVAYDVISLYETHSEDEIIRKILADYPDRRDVNQEEIRECLEDIQLLKKENRLFSKDLFEPLSENLAMKQDTVKALCLHVAHTCNLNCSYCFAAQGKYHGERDLMSFETGKKAIDFLISHSGDRHNLEVDFFGGEPLMNWETVKEIVAYARLREKEENKHFRFTLTTNGVLIDQEVMDFCNREMDNVVLSLDGRKEVHDHFRKDYQGRGSYETVVPLFQAFAQSRRGKSYYIRGTFTHHNTDFTKDIFHMADLGFTELSMEPVVCPPSDPYALTQEDLPVLYEQYEILAKEMLRRKKEGRPFTFYHYMLDLSHGPCIYKRIAGCGSGTEYLAVTPKGELYPCHQFVGETAYRLGDLEKGIVNSALRDRFASCNVYARPQCRDCWARLYCSGGCAANAYHATGDIGGIYEYGCQLFKKRLECAIMLQVAESEEEG